MHCPEPGLKMCQGTVPAENLDHKSINNPAYMHYFNPSVASAGEGPEDKEYYPEEMNKDYDIC